MIPFLLAHQTYEVEKRDHLEQVYMRTATKKSVLVLPHVMENI